MTYREHDVLVVFDYLHLLICEIEFKFHDTYPLQEEELFLVNLKKKLKEKNLDGMYDIFKKK